MINVTFDKMSLTYDEPCTLIYPVDEEGVCWDIELQWLAPSSYTPDGYNIYLGVD